MLKSRILKLIVTTLLLVVLPLGVYVALQAVREKKKAAVPEGEFNVSLSPTTGEYALDQTFPVAIKFDLGDEPTHIAAIAIRLNYSYSETEPPLSVVDADTGVEGTQIQIAPEFKGGSWTCPVNKVEYGSSKATLDLACVNTGTTGYTTDTEVTLATITLKATKVPAVNPVKLTFDPTESIITRKSDGEDFLAIPSSSGSYTIKDSEGACELGDANCDGKVDDFDLSTLLRKWKKTSDIADVDFDKSGLVDDADLSILLGHWTG